MRNKNDPSGKLRVPWLSIMGNHDYGGAGCLADWQAQIDFTKMDPLKSWVMPYQFFTQRIRANGYFIDIILNEVNHDDCCLKTDHGICHQKLCTGEDGFKLGSEELCMNRMHRNKDRNMQWLDTTLATSKAEGARWQIVVGHYIEMANVEQVTAVMKKHGAQLYVGGHKHEQNYMDSTTRHKSCNGVPTIVTGGGGGIGRQGLGYGFFNIVVSQDMLTVQLLISGVVVNTYKLKDPMEEGQVMVWT